VNNSTGAVTSFAANAQFGAPGTSVEWIEERPTVNNALPPLADFGQFSLMSRPWFWTKQGGSCCLTQQFNPDPNSFFATSFSPITVAMMNGQTVLAQGTDPAALPQFIWHNYQ
jgi:hypothetical protein